MVKSLGRDKAIPAEETSVVEGPCGLTAVEIASRVGGRELHPTEILDAYLDRIDEARSLKALITSCEDYARRRAGAQLAGPLAGVPLIVKDMFDTAGVRTTYGSAIFRDHVPDRTAESVMRLERAGAVVLGKANQDEFAWGTTTQNPHYGTVENPVRPGKVAGGSSGGNAAALAAFACALGLGTDTGGSVRIPAACCSVVGFKPSHGSISLDGVFQLSPSFDVVGPMARTVEDCAVAFSVLADVPIPRPDLTNKVIGLLTEVPKASASSAHEPTSGASAYRPVPLDETVRQLSDLGAKIVEVTLPAPEAEIVPLFLHEAAISHGRTFPARRADYGPVSQFKWDTANAVPATQVDAARTALNPWRAAAREQTGVDLLLAPTLGMEVPSTEVWEPDVRVRLTAYTREVNFLGWAALAIGDFQLIGASDTSVLAAGLAWERAYGPVARGETKVMVDEP